MAEQKQNAAKAKSEKPKSDKPKVKGAPRPGVEQLKAQYDVQGGRCYISGQPLEIWGAGKFWKLVDGKAVLTSAARDKGKRSWDAYRAIVVKKAQAAQAVLDRYKALIREDGSVRYALEEESPVEATAAAQ